MKTDRMNRGVLSAAAAVLVLAMPGGAEASKEKFDRTKPHVNIGTAGAANSEGNAAEKKPPAATSVRKPMQDLKGATKASADSRAKEKANKTKSANPLRAADDDTADKTDKDKAARAKRRPQ